MGWLGLSPLIAQKTWIQPDEINPADSVTIYVDIKACECQRLLGATEVFLWTWQPAGDRDEAYENGEWTASNPALSMKSEGNDVWSYTMIPTEFYGVDAQTVFDNDFSFLVKAADGSGEGGGGCDEDKTEDLELKVDPPVTGPRKLYTFPDKAAKDTVYITPNDVITLLYDNNLEEKPTMQGVDDLFVWARGNTAGGKELEVTFWKDVGQNPELEMTNLGNGLFRFSFIPSELYEVPEGDELIKLRLQVVRKSVSNSNDIADPLFNVFFKCE